MKTNTNINVWNKIYEANNAILAYPDSCFITLMHRYLSPSQHQHVLDFGFGGGANMFAMIRRGHAVTGVEISEILIEKVRAKMATEAMSAELHCLTNGCLPFADHSFDAITSWNVLGYNNRSSLKKQLAELHRVLKPGGTAIASIPAYGDISHESATPINELEFISNFGSQAGVEILFLSTPSNVQTLIGWPNLDIGLYQVPIFNEQFSRYWVFIYQKESAQGDAGKPI